MKLDNRGLEPPTPMMRTLKALEKINKGDTLIICGDFGFIWNESKEELGNIKWLSKRNKVALIEKPI